MEASSNTVHAMLGVTETFDIPAFCAFNIANTLRAMLGPRRSIRLCVATVGEVFSYYLKVKRESENGTGSKAARSTFHSKRSAFAALVPVPLSGGPTEPSMAREKRGQAPCVTFCRDSELVSARSQSPFLASVFTLRT